MGGDYRIQYHSFGYSNFDTFTIVSLSEVIDEFMSEHRISAIIYITLGLFIIFIALSKRHKNVKSTSNYTNSIQ